MLKQKTQQKTSPLRKETTTKHSGCLWLMRGKENRTKEKTKIHVVNTK